LKDGFYAQLSPDGLLNMSTITDGTLQAHPSATLADYLISFIEFDFTSYQAVLDGLLALDIFAPNLDIRYDDFDECREYCGMIADGLVDSIGRYFANKELIRINTVPDDGTASFWIYQARQMVDALAEPIHAHTFISHAFHFLFTKEGSTEEKLSRFFKWYPAWREHLFEEAFEVEGDTIRHRKHIRSYTELMLFCLLELLEQDIIIRRCVCCGGYFIPKTKKMTLYCDRVIKGNKTCKDLAPGLKRKQDKQRDAALTEYDRLYDLYYARMERYEGRVDLNRPTTETDISQDAFFIWSAKAQSLRKKYIARGIEARDFLEHLTLK